MPYHHPTSGHWINLTPDELFAAYADLTVLLPNSVLLWGLNLVTHFHDTLSFDIQEALQTNPLYLAPNLSTLMSHSSELAALHSLRVAAVCQFTLIRAQEGLISKTILRKMNKLTPGVTALAAPPSVATSRPVSSVPLGPSNNVSILTRSFTSLAKQTMR
jgi:hypothetical protein